MTLNALTSIAVTTLALLAIGSASAHADPLISRPEFQCTNVGGGLNPSLRIRVTSYSEAGDHSATPINILAYVEQDGQPASKPIPVVIDTHCTTVAPRHSTCTTTVTGEGFFLQGSRASAQPARIFNATYRGESLTAGVVCTF